MENKAIAGYQVPEVGTFQTLFWGYMERLTTQYNGNVAEEIPRKKKMPFLLFIYSLLINDYCCMSKSCLNELILTRCKVFVLVYVFICLISVMEAWVVCRCGLSFGK